MPSPAARHSGGPRRRAGPSEAGAGDNAFVERAIASLAATLSEHRIVTAFVRCHPLLSPSLDTLRRGGAVVEHGELGSIDLMRSAEETWSALRENHRRAIVRARRAGYQVRIDESWQRLDDFVAIYAAAMDRLGAAEHRRLPRDYLVDLRAAVGPRVHLCVVEKDGDLAAAALLSEVDGIVEYHLSGMAPDHTIASPTEAPHRAGQPVGPRARQPRVPPGRQPAPRRPAHPLQARLLALTIPRRLVAAHRRLGRPRPARRALGTPGRVSSIAKCPRCRFSPPGTAGGSRPLLTAAGDAGSLDPTAVSTLASPDPASVASALDRGREIVADHGDEAGRSKRSASMPTLQG